MKSKIKSEVELMQELSKRKVVIEKGQPVFLREGSVWVRGHTRRMK